MLDTGSSINGTICNEKFVTNIRKSNSPLFMTTNAGTRKLEYDATIPGLGDVKFDPELSANVLGFNFVRSKFPVDYDQKGNCFNVITCLLYTSPSPRDLSTSRMPSSA